MLAEDFSLSDQNGVAHRLSDFRGKWVVLYFYPKDDTTGCTKEACSFRDRFEDIKEKNVVVLGVSKDSVKSHKKFAEKYSLPFLLLSDENLEVIKKYGAWGLKKFMGREYEGILRNTFLIDPKGEIVKEYKLVNPLTHVREVLEDL